MRQLQKKIKSGKLDVKEDDPFELFIAATNIRYCYYNETHKILGNTYGMCILQDFEAFTPNLLARTIETVEGGGLVIILLRSVSSLKQLYTMTMILTPYALRVFHRHVPVIQDLCTLLPWQMTNKLQDVHSRFRTEAHQDVVSRFNERFLLSLSSCKSCVVIDDQLNILPVTSNILNISPVPTKAMEDTMSPKELELQELKSSLQDTQPIGCIAECCQTLDQAKAVLKFVDAISEKTLCSTVVLTAARGRGKSAALGLAIASAVAFGYSNIFVTAPSPENLKTLFEFIFKGMDTLDYQEHLDYEIIQSTNPDFNKAIVRVNIFKEHRQTIQYIHPSDSLKLGQAELVCIDEAAAIPLPLVKSLLGPYLVFMASTVNGYEGTGRSLSLKLVQQLRQQAATFGNSTEVQKIKAVEKSRLRQSATGRALHEISLTESIRYADGDPVESWLNSILCLESGSIPRILSGCPVPAQCDLYYVNRETLFSYHKASEAFLHRVMSLCVASHYKNTPNDLQMLSDAPAFNIFVLLGPVTDNQSSLPEILCVIQVCLEGEISKSTIMNSLSRGRRAAGDLIPWTVSQQFQDHDFPGLSGARIVRIATHPDYQGMGYGSRAVSLLQQYYEGNIPSLKEVGPAQAELDTVPEDDVNLMEEHLIPRKHLPPLLLKLSERKAEKLDYLGVSYGLTANLLRFWKKAGFSMVYLRQTANDLTGEHSCIMLKVLAEDLDDIGGRDTTWLPAFRKDFLRRFVSLLSYQFRRFHPSLALNILSEKGAKLESGSISRAVLDMNLSKYDMRRLELYAQNMVDYHLIMDLVPVIAKLVFLGQVKIHLSAVQSGLLLGLGLQHKTVDDLEKEFELPTSQLLALLNKVIRKVSKFFTEIVEADIESLMAEEKDVQMNPVGQTLEEDLKEASDKVKEKQKQEKAILTDHDLTQYAIKGSEEDWKLALNSHTKAGIISVKGKLEQKRKIAVSQTEQETMMKSGKRRKVKQKN